MKRLLVILGAALCQVSLADEPVPEYVMKATYLYNFAVFTEWPSASGDTFNLCVLGQDNFGRALNRIEGKSINGRRLAVARLSTLHNIKSCHMLFVTEHETPNMRKILDELGDAPVLTVTDTPVQPGAMIVISLDGRRLTFDVNIEMARHSRLNISSKLMQLARSAR